MIKSNFTIAIHKCSATLTHGLKIIYSLRFTKFKLVCGNKQITNVNAFLSSISDLKCNVLIFENVNNYLDYTDSTHIEM